MYVYVYCVTMLLLHLHTKVATYIANIGSGNYINKHTATITSIKLTPL